MKYLNQNKYVCFEDQYVYLTYRHYYKNPDAFGMVE